MQATSLPEWIFQRSLRITSTFVKRVVTAMRNNSKGKEARRNELAAGIVAPRDLSKIPAIRRGKDLEPVACGVFLEQFLGQASEVPGGFRFCREMGRSFSWPPDKSFVAWWNSVFCPIGSENICGGKHWLIYRLWPAWMKRTEWEYFSWSLTTSTFTKCNGKCSALF